MLTKGLQNTYIELTRFKCSLSSIKIKAVMANGKSEVLLNIRLTEVRERKSQNLSI